MQEKIWNFTKSKLGYFLFIKLIKASFSLALGTTGAFGIAVGSEAYLK